jgi:hypothetical protein
MVGRANVCMATITSVAGSSFQLEDRRRSPVQ